MYVYIVYRYMYMYLDDNTAIHKINGRWYSKPNPNHCTHSL